MVRAAHVLLFTIATSPVVSQCAVDGLAGGLGYYPGVPVSIVEYDGGSGPEPWLGGGLGTSADYGVRHLVGAQWQGTNSPFRGPVSLEVHDAGAGPEVYAVAVGGTTGIRRWTGTQWAPVGLLPSASVLHSTNLGTGNVLLLVENASVRLWTGAFW